MAITQTTYSLDVEDCIVEVSRGWDDFALENDGPDVVADSVIGRKLSEFIEGDATRMWIISLVTSARAKNKEMIRFYRCDSPNEKRYMKMIVTPEGDGRVSVTSKLIRTEKMRKMVDFVHNVFANYCKCSICNQIRVQEMWLEPDDAKVLGLLDDETPIPVVYTVCETCMKHNGLLIK